MILDIAIASLVGMVVLFTCMLVWSSELGWRWRVRYLDHDPYYDNYCEMWLYEYEVTHLDGDVSYVWAHTKTTDGPFANFHVADDDTWALYTSRTYNEIAVKPFGKTRGFDKVAELEGIKRIERRRIGRHTWNVVCDHRDRGIDHVEKTWVSKD